MNKIIFMLLIGYTCINNNPLFSMFLSKRLPSHKLHLAQRCIKRQRYKPISDIIHLDILKELQRQNNILNSIEKNLDKNSELFATFVKHHKVATELYIDEFIDNPHQYEPAFYDFLKSSNSFYQFLNNSENETKNNNNEDLLEHPFRDTHHNAYSENK